MIRVQEDRVTALIRFRYETIFRKNGEQVRVTICDILSFGVGKFDYTPIPPEEFDHYALDTGKAYCSAEDNFNKEVGRKLALKRAMEDRSGTEAPYTRPMRTAIWEAYHNRS